MRPLPLRWFMPILVVAALRLACAAAFAAPADVRVTIDWTRVSGHTPEKGYGTNVFTGLDPAVSGRHAYQAALRQMAPGVLRLHSNSMVRVGDDKGWLNPDLASWNARKIAAVFDALADRHAEIIMNIPGWPAAWCLPGSKRLDPARYDDYARLCERLVEVVNNQQHRGVTYWENVNEREVEFPATPEGMGAFAEIFRRCAVAMQRTSSIPIKVSPAWMNLSQQQRLELFLDAPGVRENLGFFAFHQYATPRAADLDGSDARTQHLFDRAAEIAAGVQRFQAALAKRGLGDLVLAYDEYNLAATYDIDAKHLMQGRVAMVFSALLHERLAETGLAVWPLSWNERDGAYGLMDEAGKLRPNGLLLALTNRHLRGTCFRTGSSDGRTVDAFAVVGPQNAHAVLLINRSAAPATVTLAMAGWQPGTSWTEERVGDGAMAETGAHRSASGPITVAVGAYDVTLCVFAAGAAAGAK